MPTTKTSSLRFWRTEDTATPADALSFGIPTLVGGVNLAPKLGPLPGEFGRRLPGPQAGLQVKPDTFSAENPAFYDQSPEDQKKALHLMQLSGYDRVIAEGLQPPRIPHGNATGAVRSLVGGLTGKHLETPGLNPTLGGVSSLVGEGLKYASLMKMLGGLGAGPLLSEFGAGAISGGARQMQSDSPSLESAAIEAIAAPATGGLIRGTVAGLGAKGAATAKVVPPKPVRKVPVPDKQTVSEAGQMVLRTGVTPGDVAQLQDWWGGTVDNIADHVKKAAYKVAPDISRRIRNALVGNAPSQLKDILKQRQMGISLGRATAEDVSLSIRKNIPSKYHEDVYKILDPEALGETGTIPTQYHDVVMAARTKLDDLGLEFTEYGLDANTYWDHVGMYLGRYYRKHSGIHESLSGSFRKLRAAGNRLRRRKLGSVEARKEAGLITDPSYALSRTIGDITYDIETYKAFRRVAQNPEWTSPTMADGFHSQPVPAEPKLYGDLAGKYVTPEIRDEIMAAIPMRGEFGKLYDRLLGSWKFGKTALSPATHGRNIVSNVILADLGGLSPVRHSHIYAKSAKDYFTKGRYYKEARDVGLLGTDWYGSEIRPLLESGARGESMMDKLWRLGSENKLARGAGKMGDLYQGEEHFFKLAMYVQGRTKMGLSPEAAAARAQKHLFDYSDLSPALKGLRRAWYGHPFLTFTAKSVPVIAEAAVKHPLRFGKYIAGMRLMNEYSKHSLGLSDAEYEKIMELRPDWQKNGFNVLLWRKDKTGKPLIWDFTYNLPWGDIADQGRTVSKMTGVDIPVLGPLVDRFLMGNPLPNTTFGLLSNQDMFREREIVSDADKLMGNAGKERAKYIGRQLLPTGIVSAPDVINALRQKPTKSGDVRDVLQVVADRLAGIRVRPIDEETSLSIKTWVQRKDINALKKYARKITFDQSMSDAERDAEMVKIEAQIDTIATEIERIQSLGDNTKTKTSGSLKFW